MRRVPWVVLSASLLVGCSLFGGEDEENPPEDQRSEVPPPPSDRVGVISGGQSQDYVELYNDASSKHRDLQRTLEDRTSINWTRVVADLQEIRNSLRRMASMVGRPAMDRLQGLADEVDGLVKRVKQGTWTQPDMAKLDRIIRDVRSNYSIEKVNLVEQLPPDPRPAVPTAANGNAPPADPALGKTSLESLKGSPWLFYKAWVQEHQDLVGAVKAGDDKATKEHYLRVLQVLKWMDESVAGLDRTQLANYRNEYEAISSRTNGFTQYGGVTNKDWAVQALTILGQQVPLTLNPDRR
jgi:hypothetical protein